MEHTDRHIRAINFGNSRLDRFLENEQVFINLLNSSEPYRFCMLDVFTALVELNEIPAYWRMVNQNDQFYLDSRSVATEWCKEPENEKLIHLITRAVMVITHLAEKRLKVNDRN